ncbi:MAG: hypothetical protein JJ882_15300 [Balneola sp.]|nr:hypothetical protein [Balneola sp.]
MSSSKQLDKLKFIAKKSISNYFEIYQSVALLVPLLEDENLFQSWKGTPGIDAVSSLQWTLYMSIIADMRALLFDTDDRVASLANVIKPLVNTHLIEQLRADFCDPPGIQVGGHDEDPALKALVKKQIQEGHIKSKKQEFDELVPRCQKCFKEIKESDLGRRVENARNKLIAHNEMRTDNGERRSYNPKDFGLKWGDAQEVVLAAKKLVFDINLLINNSSYDVDGFRKILDDRAKHFWERVERA